MTSPINSLTGTWPTSSAQSNPLSAARANVMKAVSSELGISQSQLQSQLQAGQSLSQIATAAGVSSDQLNATITNALQQSNLPAGTDIASLATKMANHVGVPQGPAHRMCRPRRRTMMVAANSPTSQIAIAVEARMSPRMSGVRDARASWCTIVRGTPPSGCTRYNRP
jgi:hypothetical protein